MPRNKLTLKIIFFLIFSDILETFTQYCFKRSALPQSGLLIANLFDVFAFIRSVIFSGFLWLGLLSVFSTFTIWSTILSKIELSVAVPIASFSYILVPLISIFFLHEQMSMLDWTGIFFILAGVIMVSLSAQGKDEVSVVR